MCKLTPFHVHKHTDILQSNVEYLTQSFCMFCHGIAASFRNENVATTIHMYVYTIQSNIYTTTPKTSNSNFTPNHLQATHTHLYIYTYISSPFFTAPIPYILHVNTIVDHPHKTNKFTTAC